MTEGKSLKIAAVGDISLGDHPVCAGHGMRAMFSKHGDDLLNAVKGTWSDSDIVLGNLETVASDKGLKPNYLPSYEMRGEPSALSVLKNAGFNLLTVANNHSMQHGLDAFEDTLVNLSHVGLEYFGVDDPASKKTKPFIHHKNAEDHVFIAFSMRPEQWTRDSVPYSLRYSSEVLLEEVRSLRERYNGFIVLSLHWGLEYVDYPGPDQIRLGRALIDAGVDVIIGHHPHVLQPYEHYNNGLILYSLGNFLFDLWHPETKPTVVAQIELSEGCPPKVKFIPVIISEQFIPKLANLNDGQSIEKSLAFKAGKIEEILNLDDDEYYRIYRDRVSAVRPRKYRYFLRNIYKYNLLIVLQSVIRTFGRRLSGK